MPAATDLADCSASELLQLYRSGQASPVEATRAVLERIARLNPRLNAFCLVDADAALQAARESEARWQAARRTARPAANSTACRSRSRT